MKATLKIAGSAAVLAAALATTGSAAGNTPASWLDNTISPVANPIYFEDPKVTSEVHPVYMYHFLPDTFYYKGGSLALGGQVQVTAVQLRYALTDRLGLIATKDGYIEFQPSKNLPHEYGWADLAAGLKYELVDDEDNQFLLTPGFTLTIPTGCRNVFQNHGSGEWNLFVSAEKGFDSLHLTANTGFIIPNNFSGNTAQLHYSLQADYYVCQYFIPFVVANGYTIISDGNGQSSQSLKAVPLNTEGYDLINFGSADASGATQLTLGGGARARLVQNVDVGIAYEAGVVHPVGIFEGRITADVIWRF